MIATISWVQRHVRRALARWRPLTDTDRWEIGIVWREGPDSADGSLMGVSVQPQYEAATLYVNRELILASDRTARGIEYDILHELCHLHTAQLSRLAEKRQAADRVADADETATKKFASALWRTRYGEEPPA
jgi:hypothetical protein